MRRRSNKRWGATVVELAFAAPILFAIVFAALEYARMNMLWNTTVNAAYEGARRGIVPGASNDDVEDRVESILRVVSARNADITITPSTITNATDEVTVRIEVPMNSNGWLVPVFFADRTISSECTLTRDLVEENFTTVE